MHETRRPLYSKKRLTPSGIVREQPPIQSRTGRGGHWAGSDWSLAGIPSKGLLLYRFVPYNGSDPSQWAGTSHLEIFDVSTA
jgi:hypothetical protein